MVPASNCPKTSDEFDFDNRLLTVTETDCTVTSLTPSTPILDFKHYLSDSSVTKPFQFMPDCDTGLTYTLQVD